MSANKTAQEIVKLAAKAADEKRGENITALDVSETFPFADIQMIVTGTSERGVTAIADGIEEALIESAAHIKASRREGKNAGRWVLLDFGDVIVHVMHEEERDYYALERLWSVAPVVELEPQPTP